VEDTLHLLGHALRKAVVLAAQVLSTSAEAVVEDAGLVLVGHSSLKAALELDWGEPRARECALGLVLAEVARWQRWLAQQQTLAAEQPLLKAVMEIITQIIAQDTEPDPGGGPGGRRLKPHVALDRRISIEDKYIRHGRKSSAKTFNGFKEHFAVDLDSKVIWEVVMRPANEPEHAAVELLAAELEKAPGLLQLDIDLGYMASPRIAQWAEQGVSSIARPWPQGRHCSRSMLSPWTLQACRSRVPVARASPWSWVSRPSFRLRRVTGVPCAPSARKPRVGKAEA
jgi:hypothetical protein